ncbi:bifunctional UDP-N-acetylmuramoyl-tripeptide:D-alanyl-D-alanine ligase/alanine racemase [Taibaiella lutea]|uniref:Alanine racemase n=1 Tax=Taibaiella lutea TaxID=2608001 RepID=A0A5M6CML4_9BACT|nr:bifunctional UDP-N-acetylmuramoyl-tripeptide:D-alanyl-D-alanine ligase/alanine racemase [Taibaiella lutea]KAA5536374.1 bifunctional UDP-N-acetylmuramoyl-tripeptide:D-alanyl-D-alanine ligase/alanine racemase [Taibaiella lutea]
MLLSDIQKATKAELISEETKTIEIDELLIDSRKIANADTALFIAIRGSHRDGHQFIADAYKKGVRVFLISEKIEQGLYPYASFLKVNDTVAALQQLAAYHRNQYHFPIIGITGSNGKTIVKEWLFQLLSADYKIVRSPKSYNSQIGVPLSVWGIEAHHNLGIFEAGISQPGEMNNSEKVLHPDIGIFTNIGEAHSEGFMNQRQKINEKLALFRQTKELIYCKDHHELNESIVQYAHQVRNNPDNPLKLFTWSQKSDATLRIHSIERENNVSVIKASYEDKERTITIPFIDHAYIEDAIHCWCVLLLLKLDDAVIAERMLHLHAVAMRLQLLHGMDNCTIINDTYNSDLTSLQIALDFLEQQRQHPRKTVILSDMLQMGKPDRDLYEEVADLIHQKNIYRIICIGPALYKNKEAFRKYKKLRSIFFKSTDELLKKLHMITFENEAILLKGARSFRFEKIEKLLEQKIHKTVLEINLTAIQHNLNVYRDLLPKGVKTMAMVKAYSYGSGSYEIANLLQFEGIDYLTVAYVDEGVALRKAGITAPIMVMSPEAAAFDRMISWKLEPEIFSIDSLQSFLKIANAFNEQHYPIHIKLDTGMHRLGFMKHELDALIAELKNNNASKVVSIFSHLAGSDAADFDGFTEEQAMHFNEMSKYLKDALEINPLLHLVNSSGITRHPELYYDMVRLGIGMYGFDGSNKIQSQLRHIGTLKTTIAQIKELPKGETVGYSRKGILKHESKIATVSIGYADGYFRDFGNGIGHMLVNGQPAKIIGSVCMDMCMLDISGIENVKVGDEVIVFGNDLPVSTLADWAKTIPYEILTSISQRVNRIYVNE